MSLNTHFFNYVGTGGAYTYSTSGAILAPTNTLTNWSVSPSATGTIALATVPFNETITAVRGIVNDWDGAGRCDYRYSFPNPTFMNRNRVLSFMIYADSLTFTGTGTVPVRARGGNVQLSSLQNIRVIAFTGSGTSNEQGWVQLWMRRGWNEIRIPDYTLPSTMSQSGGFPTWDITGPSNVLFSTSRFNALWFRNERDNLNFSAGTYGWSKPFYISRIQSGDFQLANISVTFDDGLKSQFAFARSVLNAANIKGCFYLVQDWQQNGSSAIHMSQAEVRQLLAEGHHIGCHSINHNIVTAANPFGTPTTYSQAYQVWNMIPWLQTYAASGPVGFGPDDCFLHASYPGGVGNGNTQEFIRLALYNLGFLSARSAENGPDDHYWFTPYQRKCYYISAWDSSASPGVYQSPQKVLDTIDYIIAMGGNVQFIFHGFGTKVTSGATSIYGNPSTYDGAGTTPNQLWYPEDDFQIIINGLVKRRQAGQLTLHPPATMYKYFKKTLAGYSPTIPSLTA